MDHSSRLVAPEVITAREQEFYWLWILATTAYGVGDILTTLTILTADTGVTEANLLITQVFAALGEPGLVLLKLSVFLLALSVSVAAAEYWQDRFLYYAPPLILAAFGTAVTASNLQLFLHA